MKLMNKLCNLFCYIFSKTAKKPNQRKGPQAERTRTIRKTKRQEDDDS